jgi:hypothetical protein
MHSFSLCIDEDCTGRCFFARRPILGHGLWKLPGWLTGNLPLHPFCAKKARLSAQRFEFISYSGHLQALFLKKAKFFPARPQRPPRRTKPVFRIVLFAAVHTLSYPANYKRK